MTRDEQLLNLIRLEIETRQIVPVKELANGTDSAIKQIAKGDTSAARADYERLKSHVLKCSTLVEKFEDYIDWERNRPSIVCEMRAGKEWKDMIEKKEYEGLWNVLYENKEAIPVPFQDLMYQLRCAAAAALMGANETAKLCLEDARYSIEHIESLL